MFHVKPIDPRLLRYARATRFFLAASVALGLTGAGLVIAQAMLIAEIVVGAFQRGDGVTALTLPLGLLALVAVGRAAVSWLTELAAHKAGAAVKSELRLRLLERAVRLGPSWLDSQRTGVLTTLATRASTRWTTTSRAICPSWGWPWWCRWRCSPGSSPRTGSPR
ncbi:hypothetical protein SVIO_056040 [Streptomyces violaceusniger]|uniref:ABC transmembrane type-1 domain-containing protein n=1 Tax=Streptomyces violaceusniger TaxID=68280 RepID=A0A4D4L078_STRVO|nr:hypothetical protein SVIO_056040 [Streptomyces violaceusniger]